MDENQAFIRPPDHNEIVTFLKLKPYNIYELFGIKISANSDEVDEAINSVIVTDPALQEIYAIGEEILKDSRLRFLYDNYYSSFALEKQRKESIKNMFLKIFDTLRQSFNNINMVLYASNGCSKTATDVWNNCYNWKWLFRGSGFRILHDIILNFAVEITSIATPPVLALPVSYLLSYPAILFANISVLDFMSNPSFLETLEKILDYRNGSGFKNLWFGFGSYLAYNTIFQSLSFGMEYLNSIIVKKSSDNPQSKSWSIAARVSSSQIFTVLAIFAITSPITMLQVQNQAQILKNTTIPITTLAKNIYNQFGIRKFYHGSSIQLASYGLALSVQFALSKIYQ